MMKSNLDHFSWIAPFYDRFAPSPNPMDWVGRLALPVHGWLLDAGGGTGRVAEVLQPFVSEALVADVSKGMLRQAKCKVRLNTTQAASEWLPFPDGCFERVIMVDAFHHLSDQRRAARELFRVLKPGGRLVIEELNLRWSAMKLITVVQKLLLMRSRMLYPEQLAGLFAGLPGRVDIESQAHSIFVIVDRSADPVGGEEPSSKGNLSSN